MNSISLADAGELIKHVAIRLNEPVMMVGRFGVGKSAVTNKIVVDLDDEDAIGELLGDANRYTFPIVNDNGDVKNKTFTINGCVICDVRLAQYESVDLRGFPGVNRETGYTVWHAPSTLPFIGNDEWPDDKIILLFLDEITSATPPVFSVAYQLINERRVGEHVLKPNVRIVAAGNRDDDKGVVNRMPMPLCNRMTWCEVQADHNVWCEWAQGVGIDPVVIAFIHFKPTLLMTYDPAKAEKVVATTRTWEKAAKYMVDARMNDTLKWVAVQGAIGEGPAREMRAFIAVWQKVTPVRKIIEDPMGVKVPAEADMRYATTVSVSGAMSAKTITPLYQFMERMPAEMMVLAWQLAIKRDQSLLKTPEFMNFTKKYRSVFSL